MDSEGRVCSGCGIFKFHEDFTGLVGKCSECRSAEYYSRKYPQKCFKCHRHRALCLNGICRRCNKDNGLRQCKVCGELLPLLYSFYNRRAVCKDCGKSLTTEIRIDIFK